jgi:hypothetical protein
MELPWLLLGPGGPTGDNSTIQNLALLYDTVNVTDLLRDGAENLIAIQSFYWNNAQEKRGTGLCPAATIGVEGDTQDMGGMQALLRSGSNVVAATGPFPGCGHKGGIAKQSWNYSGDQVNPSNGRYHLNHEHWNMSCTTPTTGCYQAQPRQLRASGSLQGFAAQYSLASLRRVFGLLLW